MITSMENESNQTQEVIIQQSDSVTNETIQKPRIINHISNLFWLMSAFSLFGSITGVVLVYVFHLSFKSGFKEALDFSFLKYMPYIFPLISFSGIISYILLSYAALRVRSGSYQGWRVGLIVIIVLFCFGLFTGFLITKGLDGVNNLTGNT